MTLRRGFATALQFVRKSRGLTQEDFSDISSRTYLSSLERAIKSPTLDKVEELASVLKVHPATLVVLASMHGECRDLQQVMDKITEDIHTLEAD
jgi:transcriptional regulator with XRE-family HTH domain